jgi:import inner membrane translocase subunit TIM16
MGRMASDQAREVLNLSTRGEVSRADVIRQFTKYYEANDPDKGGSFYLQSKVWNARETLLEEVKRAEAARSSGGGGGGAAGGGGSGGGSGPEMR